jgi:nicotinamide-nucleotide amidase
VDEEMAASIEARSRKLAERLRRPYADFAFGVTKQATLPVGGIASGLAGTAPAVVLEHGNGVAVALPGPPRELQELWPGVLDTPPLRRLLEHATAPERRVVRLFGVSESAVAQSLESAGGDGGGVEVTICARDFEIHIDLLVQPGAEQRADELEQRLVADNARYLVSRDERSTAELVVALLRERSLTLATAESCTGGLVAGRLTDVPGASAVFLGGIVAYSNDVKAAQLDVPQETLREHGAVSAETAEAMARGARARLGADVAVSVTGVAGPDGGTAEKPVGLVFLHASGPTGDLARRLDVPGDRETVRLRSTVAALHLVRRLVTDSAQS